MSQANSTSQFRIVGIGGRPVASDQHQPDFLKRGLIVILAVAVLSVAGLFVSSTRTAAHQPAAALTASAATLWAE